MPKLPKKAKGEHLNLHSVIRNARGGCSGGPVVKTSPSSGESADSIPGREAEILTGKPKHKTEAIL